MVETTKTQHGWFLRFLFTHPFVEVLLRGEGIIDVATMGNQCIAAMVHIPFEQRMPQETLQTQRIQN